MAIYGSLDRLNAMHDLFTAQGNKKLDAGEVDALAAFHGGLPNSSQAKTKERMIELYQKSSFSSGQKARFFELLKSQGFSTAELEGVQPNTGAGFSKLSKAAQFDMLLGLEGSGDGVMKSVTLADLDMKAAGRVKSELNKIEKQLRSKHGADAEIGMDSYEMKSISAKNGSHKELLGFVIELPIYADDHDINRAYFFNLKGERVGDEYRGE